MASSTPTQEEVSAYRGRILVVDDEPGQVALARDILRPDGHEVDTALSGEEAIARLREGNIDLVIADMMMPGMNGIELLQQVSDSWPELPVVFLTGQSDVGSAVAAIKEGAENYVTKPLDIDRFRLAVSQALERKALRDDNARLRRMVQDRRTGLGDLIGRSASMRSLYEYIEKIAPTNQSVLLLGESGTGKEVTAREIHRHSKRATGPFVPVNCASIPDSLLESELFGHVKGSFTNAVADKVGFFEAANGGTIFLDEIGATAPAMQSRLLRVLQERQVRRVGEASDRPIDVRVISATNIDPQVEIEKGNLRLDIYHRLNGVEVSLPPLRERQGDVAMLAEHFLAQACRRHKKKPKSFSTRAKESLESYGWPGNVRELENVIEKTAILAPRRSIGPSDLDLPSHSAAVGTSADLWPTLDDVIRNHILTTLERCGGNRTRAADLLGMPRTTLKKKMEKLGVE